MSDGKLPVAALGSLLSPLEEITEDKFRRVVEMLEPMRHKPEIRLALDRMRERIAQVRPPRRITVQRILYRAVEDALVNLPDKTGAGWVSRQVLSFAWAYLEAVTDPALWQDLQNRAADMGNLSMDDVQTLEADIWNWAAGILSEAVTKAQLDKGVRRALLGDSPDLLAELQHAVRFFEAALPLRLLRNVLLLKPIKLLSGDQKAKIKHIIVDWHQGNADRLYIMLLGCTLRMDVPGEFLDFTPVCLTGFPSPIKAEMQARLTLFVMGDMDRRMEMLNQAARSNLAVRAGKVALLVEALATGEKNILTGDRDTRKQLLAVRGTAENVVKGIVEEANTALVQSLKSGRNAEIELRRRSEDSLHALRRCEKFAEKVGMEGSVRGVLDHVIAEMRQSAIAALGQIREANQAREDPSTGMDDLFWTVRMLELVGNTEEADRIRRDGMRMAG